MQELRKSQIADARYLMSKNNEVYRKVGFFIYKSSCALNNKIKIAYRKREHGVGQQIQTAEKSVDRKKGKPLWLLEEMT